MLRFIIILPLLTILACNIVKPRGEFEGNHSMDKPNYADPICWAALPSKLDSADRSPQGLSERQSTSQVDVFYLYPTSYLGKRKQNQWNASVYDEKLNRYTDKSSILYQASLFNEVGKVYAPRYRQAHYNAYLNDDRESAYKAFDLAYSDVKAAFEYYLEHYNQGRPIIIASHSQGTNHAIRLIKDYFDGKTLQNKLVVAYLAGMPVPESSFKSVKACERESDTGCICSWRTYKHGHVPKYIKDNEAIIVTNPLSWTRSSENIGAEKNLGMVLLDFYKEPIPGKVGAQIHKSILWADKPRFKGSVFYLSKNYHRGDFNLFYMNIRQNAKIREGAFWK